MIRVPAHVVKNPVSITVEEIEKEENLEVKRVMIDQFGAEKYLLVSGAEEINRSKRGILYRKEIKNDEPIVMVKVKNSTPEPDGSTKDYFLRVPPDIKTATEAVAWTFGLTVEEYEPLQET